MATAQFSYGECNGGYFLRYDCTGPYCMWLIGFPNVTCTTDGNDMSCSTDVLSCGDSQFLVNGGFLQMQNELAVASHQDINIIPTCDQITIDSDGMRDVPVVVDARLDDCNIGPESSGPRATDTVSATIVETSVTGTATASSDSQTQTADIQSTTTSNSGSSPTATSIPTSMPESTSSVTLPSNAAASSPSSTVVPDSVETAGTSNNSFSEILSAATTPIGSGPVINSTITTAAAADASIATTSSSSISSIASTASGTNSGQLSRSSESAPAEHTYTTTRTLTSFITVTVAGDIASTTVTASESASPQDQNRAFATAADKTLTIQSIRTSTVTGCPTSLTDCTAGKLVTEVYYTTTTRCSGTHDHDSISPTSSNTTDSQVTSSSQFSEGRVDPVAATNSATTSSASQSNDATRGDDESSDSDASGSPTVPTSKAAPDPTSTDTVEDGGTGNDAPGTQSTSSTVSTTPSPTATSSSATNSTTDKLSQAPAGQTRGTVQVSMAGSPAIRFVGATKLMLACLLMFTLLLPGATAASMPDIGRSSHTVGATDRRAASDQKHASVAPSSETSRRSVVAAAKRASVPAANANATGPFAVELSSLVGALLDNWSSKMSTADTCNTTTVTNTTKAKSWILDETLWVAQMAMCDLGSSSRDTDGAGWAAKNGTMPALYTECLTVAGYAVAVAEAPMLAANQGAVLLIHFATAFLCNRMAQALALEPTGLDDICSVALARAGAVETETKAAQAGRQDPTDTSSGGNNTRVEAE